MAEEPTAEAAAAPPSEAELLAMSYEEAAKADLVLTIRSALLGEDIVIASDEAAAARAPADQVVYVLDEFRRLYAGGRLDVAALKALHRIKNGFGTARLRTIKGRRQEAPRGSGESGEAED